MALCVYKIVNENTQNSAACGRAVVYMERKRDNEMVHVCQPATEMRSMFSSSHIQDVIIS